MRRCSLIPGRIVARLQSRWNPANQRAGIREGDWQDGWLGGKAKEEILEEEWGRRERRPVVEEGVDVEFYSLVKGDIFLSSRESI